MRKKFVKNLIYQKIKTALRKIFIVSINPIDWMIRYLSNPRMVRIFVLMRNYFQMKLKDT